MTSLPPPAGFPALPWILRAAIVGVTLGSGLGAQDRAASVASAPAAAAPLEAAARPSRLAASGSVRYLIDPAPPGLDRMLLARDYDVVRQTRRGPLQDRLALEVAVWPGEGPVFEHLFPDAVLLAETESFRLVYGRRLTAMGSAAPSSDDAVYFDPRELVDRMGALAERSDRVHLVRLNPWLGTPKTHGGRDLLALRIDPPRSGAPEQTGGDPSVVVVGGMHPREPATVWMALQVAARLAASSENVTGGRATWVIPCANPDGAAHVWHRDRWWRKNRRYNGGASFGVDLNRNFVAGFGTAGGGAELGDPKRQVFRGPGPASEPETATLRALLTEVRPELWFDLHTHGRLVLAGRSGAPSDAVVARRALELARVLGYQRVVPPLRGLAVGDVLRRGSLGLVIETGTAFQAPSDAVRAEERRVWRGLSQALAWQPSLRGRVTDGVGRPLRATVSWAGPGAGVAAETDDDGRFSLWLDEGGWNLRVTADGFGAVPCCAKVILGKADEMRVTLRPSQLDTVGTPLHLQGERR